MALELYPASTHDAFHAKGVQCPAHIDEAVQQIYGACKGMGTDEQTLITVLGNKSPETRNLIALRYEELYRQPLHSLIKSETSGDFGRLLRKISTPLPETEAQILRDAAKGIGTTESLIVQIASGRTNEEMNILKKTYFDLVRKDLAVALNSELSGDFRKVVMAMLQAPQVSYNPVVHNAAKAEEQATALYKAGQGRLGTNEKVFIEILAKAPPELLKMIDAVYVAKYNNNIVKAVDKEFSGDAKKSLKYLVRSKIDPYSAIAEVFEKTMKGFGTDETELSTTLVRYQSVLPYVKAAYKKQYHEGLRDRISGETSGDYKKLLLEVFDAPHDPLRTKIKGANGIESSIEPAVVASTGVISPAYLSTQTPYVVSSSNLHPSAQGYSTTPYVAPARQQGYDLPQSTPGQASYGVLPHHASHQGTALQLGGYTQQPPTLQPGGYSTIGSTYSGHDRIPGPEPQTPGYPSPQQQPGYPLQQQHQKQQLSYPSSQQSGHQLQQHQQPSYYLQPHSYPQQPQQSGYPPQQHHHQSGFPQPSQLGYPSQQQPSYPPQQTTFPPQQQLSSYPHHQPGYPPQQTSYLSPHPGYSLQQQPSHPPQQPGYSPSQMYQQYLPAGQQPPNQTYQQYLPPGQPGYQSPYEAAPSNGSDPILHRENYALGGYPPSGGHQA